MLQDIRKENTNYWGYALVAAAGVGMLFIGLPPLFGAGGADPAVATVNDVDVRLSQYNQSYRDIQNNNPDLPAAELKKLALQQSIERSLFEQQALDNHYTLSNKALYQIIKDQFGDDKTYQGWLSNHRINADTYQNSVRREQTVIRYYQMVQPQLDKNSPLFQNYLQAVAQKRSYTLYSIPVAPIRKEITVSKEEVEKYYQEHQDWFLTPEKVNISYTIFKASDLSDPAKITVEEIAKARAENEKRAGSYLIFPDKAAAEAAEKALKDGEKTFAALQEETTDELNKGKLDLAAKGQNPSPETDNQLFALQKEGDVSPVYHTEYGYMIIQLDKIDGGKSDEEIRQQLAAKAGEGRYTDLANQAYDAAQNNKPLNAIIGITGGEIRTLDDLTSASKNEKWLDNPQLQAQLFGEKAVKVNTTGLPIELSPQESLFFMVTKRDLPAPIPLTEAYDDVKNAVQQQKEEKLVRERGEELLKAFKDGKDTAELLAKYEVETEKFPDINRFSEVKADGIMVGKLFNSPPERFSLHTYSADELILAQLDSVKAGEVKDIPEPIQNALLGNWQMQNAALFGQDLSQWLYSRAKIKTNQNILEQL